MEKSSTRVLYAIRVPWTSVTWTRRGCSKKIRGKPDQNASPYWRCLPHSPASLQSSLWWNSQAGHYQLPLKRSYVAQSSRWTKNDDCCILNSLPGVKSIWHAKTVWIIRRNAWAWGQSQRCRVQKDIIVEKADWLIVEESINLGEISRKTSSRSWEKIARIKCFEKTE